MTRMKEIYLTYYDCDINELARTSIYGYSAALTSHRFRSVTIFPIETVGFMAHT